jgi:hypothetical protein
MVERYERDGPEHHVPSGFAGCGDSRHSPLGNAFSGYPTVGKDRLRAAHPADIKHYVIFVLAGLTDVSTPSIRYRVEVCNCEIRKRRWLC